MSSICWQFEKVLYFISWPGKSVATKNNFFCVTWPGWGMNLSFHYKSFECSAWVWRCTIDKSFQFFYHCYLLLKTMQDLMQTYCNYLFYLTSYNSFTPSPHLTLSFQNVPFYQNKLNHIFTSKRFYVLINNSSNTQTVVVSGVQCRLVAAGPTFHQIPNCDCVRCAVRARGCWSNNSSNT